MEIFWIILSKFKYKVFFKEITKFKKQSIIFTPNPEILLKIKDNKEFKNILKKAHYLIADWIWLYIAFQILDSSIKIKWKIFQFILLPYYLFNLFFRRNFLYKKYWDKICWSDLTNDLLKFSEKKWVKISIIDLYTPFDLKKVKFKYIFKDKLKNKFPKLNFDYFIYNTEEKEKIINKIKTSNSKILFSALWMKIQEESVIEIMWKCKNIKIWLGIWSSFDYITWFQKRAPKIFRILWLEWLYRVFSWPRKIQRLKRIYNAIFVFIWEVIIIPPPSGTPFNTKGRK